MKVKTLNQKSKIALFAVVLVALIGLVLSVGSVVHAQEATQEEGTAPAADTTQPATTYNDANSLLSDGNGSQTNDKAKVYFYESRNAINKPPTGWTKDESKTPVQYWKEVEIGTPIAATYTDWKQENFNEGFLYGGFEYGFEDPSTVLVQGETKIDLRAPTVELLTIWVKDNNGVAISGATLEPYYSSYYSTVNLDTVTTDSEGKCTIQAVKDRGWYVNIKADSYMPTTQNWLIFKSESPTITLTPVDSQKKILNFKAFSPFCWSAMNGATATIATNKVFDNSLKLKVDKYPRSTVLSVVWFNDSQSDMACPIMMNSSGVPTGFAYYLEDAQGNVEKLSDGDEREITTDGCTLIGFVFYSNANQIYLDGNGKFTYTFKHTIGEDLITSEENLTSYSPIMNKNIEFKIDEENPNKIVGINNEQNDVTKVDRYEITVTPNDGYDFSHWVVDGKEFDSSSSFKLEANNGAVISAAAQEPGKDKHLLTINYKYEDGSEAASVYAKEYEEGATYSVTSPTIESYTPDIATVEGTMGTEDITTDVTYKANGGGGGGGDVPGGGGSSSDSAVTGGTGSTSTGDFNSSAVMAIMGLVALAGGFAITGRKKLFNK